jgi:hypothetical protein
VCAGASAPLRVAAPPLDPFAWMTRRAQRRALVWLGALVAACSVALQATSASLATPAAPFGIVSFELAGSAAAAAAILDSWSPRAREEALFSLGLDYLFLVLYPLFLSLACARLAQARSGGAARAGGLLAWAVLAAAPLDAVENAALVALLWQGPGEGAARLAWLCAAPKFALVALALAYAILGLGAALLRRGRGAP